MKKRTVQFRRGFRVVLSDRHLQVARMTLASGDHEGGPHNRHRGADQWLYVVSGAGVATVGGRKTTLRKGTLILIERGETHEIRNTGRAPLQTLNFYLPPAYTRDGDELPAGRA